MKKPILIAEIGGNHEGDFDLALELGRQAIEAGADYIKYQIYTADGLVNPLLSPARYKHFQRLSLDSSVYLDLAEKIEALGGKFLASIWNLEDIELFNKHMDFYKIGSGDLTSYPFFKRIAKIGKPIVISSGLSNMQDIRDAVSFICSANPVYKEKDMLTIMQCTSMYPTATEDVNLAVLNTFKNEFPLHNIGYSHHHLETWPLDLAYVMGADMLEFHFTHDRTISTFRDHQLSITKQELIDLKARLEKIRCAYGAPDKVQTESEINADHIREFRRAVYLKKDVKAGTVIAESDLIFVRPEEGISANRYMELIGKTAVQDITAFEKLSFDMFK